MHDFIGLGWTLLRQGLSFAVPAMLLCAAAVGAVYVLFSAKREENRSFPWAKSAVLLLLVGYLVLLFFLTVFRGEGYLCRQWNLQLFAGWREAWNRFSLQVWLNPLLNVAVFMPLGFLLPLLSSRFRRWYGILAVGSGTSLMIELIQLVTMRGMFDADDLMNNTLGTMLGWWIAMILLSIKAGRSAARYLAGPLLCAAALIAVPTVYYLQPYGNLPDTSVGRADLGKAEWKLDWTPQDGPADAPVYEIGRLSQTEAEKFASDFAERMGIEFAKPYIYDDLTIFPNHSTGDFLHVYHRDGTWDYSIGHEHRPVFYKDASQLTRDEIINVLQPMGLSIPEEAEFRLEQMGEIGTKAEFSADMLPYDEEFYHGTVQCSLSEENGGTVLEHVENLMVCLRPCGREPVLTQRQALERLRNGYSEAGAVLERELEQSGSRTVKVCSCSMDWIADTKGFYQPVYRFVLSTDAGITEDTVPALK